MAKHTPGPWRYDGCAEIDSWEDPDRGKIICELSMSSFDDGDEEGNSPMLQANARLIENAPELREVAKESLDLLYQLRERGAIFPFSHTARIVNLLARIDGGKGL